ncbi:MAG: hypothetical protein PVSMB7_21950 [Chloroflexota bacterium]
MTIVVRENALEAIHAGDREPRRRMEHDMSPHGAVTAAIVCLLVMIVGRSVWLERYEVWAVLSSVCVLGALVWLSPQLRLHRPVVVFVGVTISLVFLSLWSLDEHVHVTVTATPHGYRATVNNESLFLPRTRRTGRIALYNGRLRDL